jgi:hypothetical protein
VEICIKSNWGTICRDGWDDDDAAVVCNQLGYGQEGKSIVVAFIIMILFFSLDALALWISNRNSGPVLIDEVDCDSTEAELLQCDYHTRLTSDDYSDCDYAGVGCNGERLRVQNINVSAATTYTAMISWELYSGVVPHKPSSFRIRCYNQQCAIEFSLWVNNVTLTHASVGGIISSVSFGCCVSIIYYYREYYYEAERKCASSDSDMLLPDLFTTPAPNQTVTTPSSTQMIAASISRSEKAVSSDLNMRASIIGGVLGSIIIILLLLLAVCGVALLFSSRSKSMTPKT